MFVVSVKSSRLKSYFLIALIALLGTIGGIISVSVSKAAPVAKIGEYVMRADSAEERKAFFSQFGWEIVADPVQVKEVVIPTEFDETYEKYNKLQKAQGLDLEKYKGKRLKHWSYEITNFPEYEGTNGLIHGNILVYQGTVVGGDVSSIELDGFMLCFDGTIPAE